MGRHYMLILVCTLATATVVHCAEVDKTLAELQDLDSRIVTAGDITYYGYKISWQDHSLDELQEIRQRILTTKSLARFGDVVDWQQHSLVELEDRHARVWMADELARNYNHNVDWQEHTAAELVSMRDRMAMARWLANWYGYRIDWRQFSLPDMVELRRKIIAFNNSVRSGRSVAWQDVDPPPDPYAELDPEAALAAKLLSEESGTEPLRLVAIVRKSQEILQEEATKVDELSLVTAATAIFEKHRLPIA